MNPDLTKPYCLIHQGGKLFFAAGPVTKSWLLDDLPRPTGHPVISMVPYTQLRERGYLTHDGNEPIISLVPEDYREVELADLVDFTTPVRLAGEPTFEPPDEVFAQTLSRVITEEIR